MSATVFKFLRTNLSKWVTPYVLALFVVLAEASGAPMPEEYAKLVADAAGVFLAATVMAGYGLAQRAIAARTNPANVATSRVTRAVDLDDPAQREALVAMLRERGAL